MGRVSHPLQYEVGEAVLGIMEDDGTGASLSQRLGLSVLCVPGSFPATRTTLPDALLRPLQGTLPAKALQPVRDCNSQLQLAPICL